MCSTLGFIVQGEMVGAYPFKSNKAARKHTAEQGRCLAHMFVMHVVEELPTWPEGAERKRVWVSTVTLPFLPINVQVSPERIHLHSCTAAS